MNQMIEFPNLGIYLPSVGDHITIFNFDIAFYGMMIALGILAGLGMALLEAKRTGQNLDIYYDLVIYGVISSVIGARLYYVAFSWDMYKDNLLSIFNLRQGGLAIYGGVIAAMITIVIYARIKKLSAPLLADTVAFGLPIGQAIGRWGNFFNREAFGEYTDNLLAMRIPLDVVRSSDVTELMKENVEVIDGISFIQVHPTFLYESLWCLMVVAILLLYRTHKKFDGELILIYLGGYGLGRFWIEGLRTDQLWLPGTEIAVSQVLAGVLVIVSAILIMWNRKKRKMEI